MINRITSVFTETTSDGVKVSHPALGHFATIRPSFPKEFGEKGKWFVEVNYEEDPETKTDCRWFQSIKAAEYYALAIAIEKGETL